MKKVFATCCLYLLVYGMTVAQNRLYRDEFPLGDVELLDGPLKHAHELNVQT